MIEKNFWNSRLNIIIWVKTLPYFTQMMIFSPDIYFWTKKKMSFDDIFMTTWEHENESERKKEPQIPRLYGQRIWIDHWSYEDFVKTFRSETILRICRNVSGMKTSQSRFHYNFLKNVGQYVWTLNCDFTHILAPLCLTQSTYFNLMIFRIT